MELVTGHAGTEHISAADIASLVRGLFGDTDCVLQTDDQLECTIIDANTVQVSTGDCLVQGHQCRVDIAEQLTIESGAVGYRRNDLVVVRYELGEGNIQSATLAVVKGTATTQATATDPDLTEGDIDGGDLVAEFALWRIPIEGVNVGEPVRILPILKPFLDRASDIDGDISTIRDSLSWTLVRAGDLSDTVSANGSKELRIPFTVPDGYYPVAILNHSAGNGYCYTASYTISGSYAVLYVHNIASSVVNVTAWAYILCFKRAMS